MVLGNGRVTDGEHWLMVVDFFLVCPDSKTTGFERLNRDK